MTTDAVHIHLGASKLALGLIVPITVGLGMEVHLVGRPGTSNEPEVGVSFAPGGAINFYPVQSFDGPRNLDDLDPSARAALDSRRPLLLTATLRGAIKDRRRFVEEILEIRAGIDAETLVLACENSPDEAYQSLKERFHPRVQFVPTMVNRICPSRIDGHDPRRIVRAHSLGEWVIERPVEESAIIAALDRDDLVTIVDDLRPYELRKRWLVNGGQLQLAIYAQSGTNPRRSLRAAAREPKLLAPVNHFHAEANRVLSSIFPDLDGNLDYAIAHVVAFCEITDGVKRVLSLQRANLKPFFDTFDVRFAEPARRANALDGRTPMVFYDCLAALDYLLEQRRAYDFRDPADRKRPAVLSEAADEEALASYAAMLGGWVEPAEITARQARLAIVLAAQRDLHRPIARRIGPAT